MKRLTKFFFVVVAMSSLLTVSALAGRTRPIPSRYSGETQVSLQLEGRSKSAANHQSLEMRLINPTKSALKFSGYSESSPWYRIQKWVDGEWIEHNVGWFCGTGMRECVIPARRSSVIPVHVSDDLFPLRVGVGFERAGKEETVWSTRIEKDLQD